MQATEYDYLFEMVTSFVKECLPIINCFYLVFGLILGIFLSVLFEFILDKFDKFNKKKKASDIEVITYDEFMERRQKKGDPDEKS